LAAGKAQVFLRFEEVSRIDLDENPGVFFLPLQLCDEGRVLQVVTAARDGMDVTRAP
jgi:hypothetical protein